MSGALAERERWRAAPKSGRSGRHGRIELFNELGELLEHACVIVVGMLADAVDQLAIAVGRLSAVATRLVHHSAAIPTRRPLLGSRPALPARPPHRSRASARRPTDPPQMR